MLYEPVDLPTTDIEINMTSLENIHIQVQDAIDAIKTLKANKASGPD